MEGFLVAEIHRGLRSLEGNRIEAISQCVCMRRFFPGYSRRSLDSAAVTNGQGEGEFEWIYQLEKY